MAMSKPEPISVLFVAAVSAALHGGAAVLFVPILSFLLLCWGAAAPAQIKPSIGAEDGMVFAVVAPALCAAFGFVAGALVALLHNVFAQNQCRLTVEVREPLQVRAASLNNVA
jgi:hypothetical protein